MTGNKIVYCDDCGEYLGDLIGGVLYRFGRRVTEPHKCPRAYTLAKPKRYRITHRQDNLSGEASAFSADEACRKLGWLIGDCHVREIGEG